MKTLLLFLLFTCNLTAQKEMVLIEGFKEPQTKFYEIEIQYHTIYSNDSLAKRVIKEFFFEIDQNRIAYVERLQDFGGVFVVQKPKNFIADTKNGKIIIGSYVNRFPRTKRILILHKLAKFFGARTFGGASYNVLNNHFILNAKTEAVYSLPDRISRRVDMNYIIEELEKVRPLKTHIK